MIKRTRFSKDFREKVVMEIVSGQSSVAQIAQREGINPQTVRNWKKNLESGSFQTDNEIEIELRKKIADLEGALVPRQANL